MSLSKLVKLSCVQGLRKLAEGAAAPPLTSHGAIDPAAGKRSVSRAGVGHTLPGPKSSPAPGVLRVQNAERLVNDCVSVNEPP